MLVFRLLETGPLVQKGEGATTGLESPGSN